MQTIVNKNSLMIVPGDTFLEPGEEAGTFCQQLCHTNANIPSGVWSSSIKCYSHNLQKKNHPESSLPDSRPGSADKKHPDPQTVQQQPANRLNLSSSNDGIQSQGLWHFSLASFFLVSCRPQTGQLDREISKTIRFSSHHLHGVDRLQRQNGNQSPLTSNRWLGAVSCLRPVTVPTPFFSQQECGKGVKVETTNDPLSSTETLLTNLLPFVGAACRQQRRQDGRCVTLGLESS